MRARGVPDALADLARAFRAVHVRWYVFGAQAVIAAGVPRFTADIDVTAELPAKGVSELLRALRREGFALRDVGDVDSFIAKTRVLPALHRASQIPVDVVLAGPGLEIEMMERARKKRVGRAAIPFVDLADLVALKLLAARPKDLEDVAALVRAAPSELSIEDARRRVSELGAALDDSSMLATFERIVGKKKSKKR